MLGPAKQNLSDLIAARKLDDHLGRILSLQSSCFHVEVAGKVQMGLDSIDSVDGPMVAYRRHNANGKTFRAEIVGHSAAPPNEHGRRWIGRNINQNLVPGSSFRHPRAKKSVDRLLWRVNRSSNVQLMGSLPQRQFAQSHESGFLEEILQCLLR